jgi:hypothetical protein
MDKTTVFDSPTITVWCYPTHRLVHHKMHAPCSGEVFHNALLAGSRALRQLGGRGWLSDDRANSMVQLEDEEWTQRVWFPMTRAAGWNLWAVVAPERVVGSLSLTRFAEACERMGMTVRLFSQPEPALDWLVEVVSVSSVSRIPR